MAGAIGRPSPHMASARSCARPASRGRGGERGEREMDFPSTPSPNGWLTCVAAPRAIFPLAWAGVTGSRPPQASPYAIARILTPSAERDMIGS